ncbi:hypothetical protein HAX54_027935 [Datura stramonium]|uniref:Uncharacterized protein n=1 Tax=Datura stramonium TaxID=4076 RepID=A0ABS8V3B4_DATST|nr:hypothetical protein [Datura stramonium]
MTPSFDQHLNLVFESKAIFSVMSSNSEVIHTMLSLVIPSGKGVENTTLDRVDNMLVGCGRWDKGQAKVGNKVKELECIGYDMKARIMGLGSYFSLHLLIWIDFWMRHDWDWDSERLMGGLAIVLLVLWGEELGGKF